MSTDSGPAPPADAPPGRSPTASACEPYHELIAAALAQRRNAMAIWEDLVDGNGFPAGYASVMRFVRQLRLGRVARSIAVDWEHLYGHPVYYLETFVDPQRFRGTCYRAANWLSLGLTTGRGKDDQTHRPTRPRKEVLGYPLAAFVVPQRRRAILFAAGALLLIGAGFLPWMSSFQRQAGGNHATDWIGGWWQGQPFAYAVPWSLESLGPGARYPIGNFKLGSTAFARPISLGLAALVLAGALVRVWRERGQLSARATGLTLAAILTPLILAFGVSLVRSPIHVVARYDLISWGAYYLLAGAALSRLPVALAAPAFLLWLGLSIATLVPHFTTVRPRMLYANYGDMIAQTLRARARDAELVILTASTRPTTEYYLRDAASRFRLVSYPLGTDDHLGWIDARIATDAALAASEARRFTAWMESSGPAPEVVWVVAPRTQGTAQLIEALSRLGYRREAARSSEHLLCLRRM